MVVSYHLPVIGTCFGLLVNNNEIVLIGLRRLVPYDGRRADREQMRNSWSRLSQCPTSSDQRSGGPSGDPGSTPTPACQEPPGRESEPLWQWLMRREVKGEDSDVLSLATALFERDFKRQSSSSRGRLLEALHPGPATTSGAHRTAAEHAVRSSRPSWPLPRSDFAGYRI